MLDIIKSWFGGDKHAAKDRSNPVNSAIRRRTSPAPAPAIKDSPKATTPPPRATSLRIEARAPGRVETVGPNKNVLIQNKYQREDSGTHETLKIVDDSLVETGEEAGIDPYNTGKFDRSKNWDKRYR